MTEEAGDVLGFEFSEIPVQDPERGDVGEEPKDVQVFLVVLWGCDLSRDNMELSDVGKHDRRLLL